MSWRDRATFLCGHRKSGTTLLLSLLDSHPQLCVFPPDSGFFYGYYPLYDEGDYSDGQRKARVIDVMYGNLRSDLVRLGESEASVSFVQLSGRFLERMRGQPCAPGRLLLEAVSAYRDVIGRPSTESIRRWVEKTTSTEIYASEVFGWFPGARFVHVVRDPRDNFASLKSGWNARYREQNDSIERLLQSMLDRGLLGMTLARLNAERFGADRYRIVRYEDLVTRPGSVMTEVAGFLEIEPGESLLRPTYAGRPWPGNNFDGLRFESASAVNVGRWPSRIEPHEAKVIEFHFAGVMREWGYEPSYSPAEHSDAAREHYKWLNFAQRYSVTAGADTFNPPLPVAGV